VPDSGRRLAVPPGRSSSLRCGRSTWTPGVADGMAAAIEEWPALPWALAAVVWWRAGSGLPEEPACGVQAGRAGHRVVPRLPSRALHARGRARRASACKRAMMALLTCRFSDHMPSFGVLPSASFLS
jgi:hypothetical protein